MKSAFDTKAWLIESFSFFAPSCIFDPVSSALQLLHKSSGAQMARCHHGAGLTTVGGASSPSTGACRHWRQWRHAFDPAYIYWRNSPLPPSRNASGFRRISPSHHHHRHCRRQRRALEETKYSCDWNILGGCDLTLKSSAGEKSPVDTRAVKRPRRPPAGITASPRLPGWQLREEYRPTFKFKIRGF